MNYKIIYIKYNLIKIKMALQDEPQWKRKKRNLFFGRKVF